MQLNVSDKDLATILDGLQELPYKRVYALLANILIQHKAAQTPDVPKPPETPPPAPQ